MSVEKRSEAKPILIPENKGASSSQSLASSFMSKGTTLETDSAASSWSDSFGSPVTKTPGTQSSYWSSFFGSPVTKTGVNSPSRSIISEVEFESHRLWRGGSNSSDS